MLTEQNARLKRIIDILATRKPDENGDAATELDRKFDNITANALVTLKRVNLDICMAAVKHILQSQKIVWLIHETNPTGITDDMRVKAEASMSFVMMASLSVCNLDCQQDWKICHCAEYWAQ